MLTKVQKQLSGVLLIATLCAHSAALARQHNSKNNRKKPPAVSDTTPQKDTSAALKAAALLAGVKNDGLKPFKDIINAKTVSYKSFITVHKVDEKYYLEIPDSILDREILVINRISAAPADFRKAGSSFGYAGDIIGQEVFHFTKGDGNRIFLRTKNYRERGVDSSGNGIAKLIALNNTETIINSFPVRSINSDAHSGLIEITDLMGQDNNLFGFSSTVKSAAGIGNILTDRSYIDSVKAFSNSVSFNFMRTYNRNTGSGLMSGPVPFTFRLNTGMMLLPAEPMKIRYADNRVGYRTLSYIDFDENPRGASTRQITIRWRLEPADNAAYQAGKLSDPVAGIRIYIDPSMPAKWRPFVKAGIESWNSAFEKAGFSNAITVITNEDETNAQQSTVVFMPGEGNTQTSIVVDPRSGEIMRVQMNMYLSTIDSLYKQYFIQAGALDKAANKPYFDDVLMGRLIQAYSMQVFGGLLGLKVNAGASSEVAIADLRNNAWLSSHAFNGSATDPVLVNYVVQPEDKADPANLLPRITPTDEWMINWGYRVIHGDEQKILSNWIKAASSKSDLFIGDAPTTKRIVADPRNQLGDLGNDAVKAAELGINNLKRIVPNLVDWTSEPAANNAGAGAMYKALLDQYADYARYVLNQIGGKYSHIRYNDQPGNAFEFVPVTVQKNAVQFLHRQVFATPEWLKDKKIYSRTVWRFDSVTNYQRAILGEAMSRDVLLKLEAAARNNTASAYTALAYLTDLGNGIFKELNANEAISLPRRELQQEYITRLTGLLTAFGSTNYDLPASVSAHARKLLQLLKQKQQSYTGFNQVHISLMYNRLDSGLNKSATRKN